MFVRDFLATGINRSPSFLELQQHTKSLMCQRVQGLNNVWSARHSVHRWITTWVWMNALWMCTFIECSLATGQLLIGYPETYKHQLACTASKHQIMGDKGAGGGRGGGTMPKCRISCLVVEREHPCSFTACPTEEVNEMMVEWRPWCRSSSHQTAISRFLFPLAANVLSPSDTHWSFPSTWRAQEQNKTVIWEK